MFGQSFLTGSRAYGTPHEDSDVDLVVLLPQNEASVLWQNRDADSDGLTSGNYGKQTLRFGKLNVIALIDDEEGREQFRIWKAVTEDLKLRAPVTRDQAIEAFEKAGRTFTNLGQL